MRRGILCIGELLWDALPAGLFLGGAPYNVACHLHALGVEVAFASRVGDDVLGREALRRLRARGIDTDLVQVDPSRQTGFVKVELDGDGEPAYEIVKPVAWDAIALTDALQERVRRAAALVFGSLAQRADRTRQTIHALCETDALKVFDVNMRPPFVERTIIERYLRAADVVKMNSDELQHMVAWFGLPASPERAVASLAHTFDCTAVCVTRGAAGAVFWNEGRWTGHAGYRVTVADTVGAGDAFLAGLLAGYLAGRGDRAVLDEAARLGAFVASRRGGTPRYKIEVLDEISALRLNPSSG